MDVHELPSPGGVKAHDLRLLAARRISAAQSLGGENAEAAAAFFKFCLDAVTPVPAKKPVPKTKE